MKSKIAVVVCGNSGIDYIKHNYSIDVFRSILFVNEEEYEDFVDIKADDFYKRLEQYPDTNVKTSQTATGRMVEVYNRLKTEGYTDVVVVTVSSLLSGTYQNAVLAADMVEGIKVFVFDSKMVTYPEAKMALVAAEMSQKEKSIAEILTTLEKIRDTSRVYFCVDTLKYLVKNGRLSVAAGFLGGLLKLKPLLWVSPLGKVETVEKIRTSSKALERLKEKFFEETAHIEIEPFVIYTNNRPLAEQLAKEIMEKYPYVKNVTLQPLTPVVGAHAGPGAYGIGYIKK